MYIKKHTNRTVRESLGAIAKRMPRKTPRSRPEPSIPRFGKHVSSLGMAVASTCAVGWRLVDMVSDAFFLIITMDEGIPEGHQELGA